MRSDCLPFNSIPETSTIFRDYLYAFPKVSRFYPYPPLGSGEILAQAPPPQPSEHRAKVAEILAEQNRRWGASRRTLDNVERLRMGASTVVTGQQVGLFGGPAYTFYKAITAVKLAQLASELGRECVPIFWMPTEDHDLEEIDHVYIPARDGRLQSLTADGRERTHAPVATIALGPEVEDLLRTLEESFGEADICRILRSCYQPGTTFGDAFAKLLSAIFGDSGLILVDPSDPRLHQLSSPIYSRVIADSAELNRAVLERNQELEAAGYHAQVKVTQSTSFLFTIQDGSRVAIHRHGENFEIAGSTSTPAELEEQIARTPEKFSANALLRSVVQDYLFPTIAYVGGPAEIAYFAQSEVLYRILLGRVTPILPRFSCTLVEPRIAQWLAKYKLQFTDVLQNEHGLQLLLAKTALPESIDQAFEDFGNRLTTIFEPLRQSLQKLDSTIAEAAETASKKMHYQLERLKSRAVNAELRRNTEIARHAHALWSSLFPENSLQERSIGGVYFLAKYGMGLLNELSEQARPDCPDHQIVYL